MKRSPIVLAAIKSLVSVDHGESVTTSQVIAEKFGKRHSHVLRAIENLECSNEFNERNFGLVDYIDAKGEKRPMYRITRDGFAFLVMGFTGSQAAAWKEKFLAAFNWQADEITRLRYLHATPNWQQARIEGKAARHGETDVIKLFVAYATSQGSRSACQYYMAITKATNRALFFVEQAVGKGFRDSLTASQLASIAMAERIVERALLEAMARKMFYRDAYRLVADRLQQFAGFVGQSVPGREVRLLEAA